VNVSKRHFASTPLERIQIRDIEDELIFIHEQLKRRAANVPSHELTDLTLLLKEREFELICTYDELISVNPALNRKINRTKSLNRTINSFDDEHIISNFRFRNKEQLQRLLTGFEFPEEFVGPYGHTYKGEEVLLVGLYRLSRINTTDD